MRCSLVQAPLPPASTSPFLEASQHAMPMPPPVSGAAALSGRHAGLPLSQSAPAAATPQVDCTRSDASGALSSAALSWVVAFSRLAEQQGCAAPDPFGGSWKQGPGITAPRSPASALEPCPAADSSAATLSATGSASSLQPQQRTIR